MKETSLPHAPVSCRTRPVAPGSSPEVPSSSPVSLINGGGGDNIKRAASAGGVVETSSPSFADLFFKFNPIIPGTSTASLPGAFDSDSLPFDLSGSASLDFPASQIWFSKFLTPCASEARYFLEVAENLLKNPNITSTCLFRADILYDSERDPDSTLPDWQQEEERGLVKYLKAEFKPIALSGFEDFTKRRVVVRKLIPRNPSLDPELVQTVWFLQKKVVLEDNEQEKQQNLFVYIPHAKDSESVPFYHPKVQSLAVLHTYFPALHSGTLSIHLRPFASETTIDMTSTHPIAPTWDSFFPEPSLAKRLERTALNFLRIVHKHATGRQAGYTKRVHHDQIVDQQAFQDRYVRLKQKYAKHLMSTWAEVTDPRKHVFEDLGIAAFLIELWSSMYGKQKDETRLCGLIGGGKPASEIVPEFPGFVDIGCGNGVLVYILLSEGYQGWGFDVRKRKSWSVFPEFVQEKLKEMVLVPDILRSSLTDEKSLETYKALDAEGNIQNGIFPPGTFIISNHADQLTPWTPLLAYLSKCPFISIPCCSHALNGKLTRFYDHIPQETHKRDTIDSINSLATVSDTKSEFGDEKEATTNESTPPRPVSQRGPGPQTGSLASLQSKKQMPSAYAGFTAHVMKIARDLGYKVENEVLRIPSTRNHCIVSRRRPSDYEPDLGYEKAAREQKVLELLKEEIGDEGVAAREWIEGAINISKKTNGQGH